MDKADLRHRIRVAMGEEPADLLLLNGKVISTFTEEILELPVAVSRGRIVALGHISEARQVVDLQGAYLAPAFLDAHIHVESSLLSPEGFAEAVVPRGTGAVISDPHEIANVFGLRGFQYMVEAAADLPLSIFYTIPSCVPATHLETAGAVLSAADIRQAQGMQPRTVALSEMMNYPGVCAAADDVLDKICAARELGLPIDGHSPMLRGAPLNAYLNAQILTDHECTSVAEALEKLRRGMVVALREGSAARNLRDLVPLLTDRLAHRLCIASDDRHPNDLVQHGHLDATLRELIGWGVSPLRAIRLMTLNTANLYRLDDRGGIGIGYRADLVVFERLEHPVIKTVYHEGIAVAQDGVLLQDLPRRDSRPLWGSVHLPVQLAQRLQEFPTSGAVKVIGICPGQLVTASLRGDAHEVTTGELAYLAVVERHGKNGQVGLGFVKGLGLQAGALASTVAHDSHNLILVGKKIADMVIAAQTVAAIGGGFAVVNQGQVLASLALPIAGLMSTQGVHQVSAALEEVERQARALGTQLASPMMVLSFLALPVIPHLKLTDRGLVDVDQFAVVSLRE